MANEIQETLKDVAKRIGELVENAATMTVETWYAEIGGEVPVDEQGHRDFLRAAKPAAQTIVRFDGDSVGVVPMRPADTGGLEVDEELLALHERNVRTATQYRASILNVLVGILKEYT